MIYSVARSPNWHLNLADAVESAQAGDKISVQTGAMLELAVIALQRKGKHEMGICVEVFTTPTVNGAGVSENPCADVVEKTAEQNVSNAQAYLLGLMPDELPGEPFFIQGRAVPADVDRTESPDAITGIPMFDPKLVAAAKARNAAYVNHGFGEMIRHRVSATLHEPMGPIAHITHKPTEEEIAEHQRKHGIKPSDLLPPYAPGDAGIAERFAKYVRYLPKTEAPLPPVDRTPVHPPPIQSSVGEAAAAAFAGVDYKAFADGVTVLLGKPGVPNANGNVYTREGWTQAIKEYGEKIKSGEIVPKMCFEIDSMSGAVVPDTEAKGMDPKIVDSILGSPEYTCQQCGREYLYVDSRKIMAEWSAVCFCSEACAHKYIEKNKRMPGVGAEIRCGEPQMCIIGRTDEQIAKAESDLVESFLKEDKALVEAALGVDVPAVVVGNDAFTYSVTVEQMDLIQRLFRLRRKLPKGFKIVADPDQATSSPKS